MHMNSAPALSKQRSYCGQSLHSIPLNQSGSRYKATRSSYFKSERLLRLLAELDWPAEGFPQVFQQQCTSF